MTAYVFAGKAYRATGELAGMLRHMDSKQDPVYRKVILTEFPCAALRPEMVYTDPVGNTTLSLLQMRRLLMAAEREPTVMTQDWQAEYRTAFNAMALFAGTARATADVHASQVARLLREVKNDLQRYLV